jgi:UDP-3-O-[3-hydroxymyristoyl] N-acetylglucosamine deacetylase/UDP-3-O-[3-hydroxymyristoyl] N-acetylglucosamine deacetylase/3-hydroxyacyl-[acyl-carrier-protein] dehydratase
MMHLRRQQTLRRPVSLEGRGLFFGKPVSLTLMPAAANNGITFERSDVFPLQTIPATVQHLQQAARRTAVGMAGARVEMIEHLLAALAAMQIDNCRLRLNALEPPCGDGSAIHFVEAIDRAGVLVQDEFRPCIEVVRAWRVSGADDHAWIDISPPDAGATSPAWSYYLDYNDDAIGQQSASCRVTPKSFTLELENMRTFVLEREIEQLRSLGVGLHATPQDLLVIRADGTPVDTSLRAPNECARHKLLDMVGDFALVGCDLHARIHGHRSGHELNHQVAKCILDGLHDGRCRRVQPQVSRAAA